MDLVDAPDGMPIASKTLVIKPENQADIRRSNGSRNVKFHIPDYIGYWLPSQSNFTFNIKMEGRGCPIPSRDAGMHSLFQTIRSHDGTGSHLLEEVIQYNTLVSQLFNYTKSEGTENTRAMYEGVQANTTLDNNIYWALAGGTNWSGGIINQSYIARDVQIVAPLRTKLYDTNAYIPVGAMGGIRLEMLLDNYLRSLEYTTGSLAVEAANGVPVYPLAQIPGGEMAAVGAQTAQAQFLLTAFAGSTTGANYQANFLYTMINSNGVDIGYVKVLTVDGGGDPLTCEMYCLGMPGATATVPIPSEDDLITLGTPAAAGSVAKVIKVNKGWNSFGLGAKGNIYQYFHLPLWADNTGSAATLAAAAVTAGSPGSVVSPPNLATSFGSDTERDPYRIVAPRATAAYDPTGCYPGTIMPFSIGDKIYQSTVDGQFEVYLGAVAEVQEYRNTGMPRLLFSSDRPAITAVLANDAAAPAIPAGQKLLTGGEYAYTHTKLGIKAYVKHNDRVNGYASANINPALTAAANSAINFTISDIQYQVKQIDMPESASNADMAAANSERGLQIDLETVETRLTNQAAIQGPTQNLISIPNITRALGVMSVPLNQNEQQGLQFKSLRGFPDNMTSYQYELGQMGLVPNRPVPVEKASLNNPLIQTQETNEKMKTLDSFGVGVSNLNLVPMNFSVGRQFSRPNMYFNLMAAGDLTLRSQYDNAQNFPKLFCHYINHIRSININKGGMQIMN